MYACYVAGDGSMRDDRWCVHLPPPLGGVRLRANPALPVRTRLSVLLNAPLARSTAAGDPSTGTWPGIRKVRQGIEVL